MHLYIAISETESYLQIISKQYPFSLTSYKFYYHRATFEIQT